MSQKNDTGFKTFKTDVALLENERVRLVGGLLVQAGITDADWIGTVRNETFAIAGTPVSVNLRTKPGTMVMKAAAAIVQGALVFTAAVGKVSVSASTALQVGIAMEAAAADDDWIEVMVEANGIPVP